MTASARLGMAGAALLALLALVALFAPWLAPYDPSAQVGLPLQPPSSAHLLGTDDVGQDVLSQVLVGARISLVVGVVGALLATSLGTTIGLAAGTVGGAVDFALMRVADVMMTLPTLPVMILLHVWIGGGLQAEILVIAGVMWARTARMLRAQVLSSRERGSVSAARVMGAGPLHVLGIHLLPAAFPLVVPELVRAVNAAIMFETSISFLGFGDPTAKSWGTILFYANARNAYLTSAWPWWVVPPGLAVSVTVLAFALVGYALEESARPVMSSIRRRTRIRGTAQSPAVAAAASGPVIEARAVSIAYDTPAGAVQAVEHVDLAIAPGEIVGVVGESGSGKTTLASTLLQLSRPPGRIAGGELLIEGRNVAALNDGDLCALRGAVVALVPQSAMNALDPIQRVDAQLVEALRAHARVNPAEARRRVLDLLASVGIPAARAGAYPHELSGGMRQRVVIAMAMVHTPRLVIADEPTTGLDLLRQTEILDLLRGLRERLGTAILFISHDLAAVASVADRLLVMQSGRIVEQGPTAAVMSQPRHAYTRRLVNAIPPLHPVAEGRHAGPSARPAGAPLLAVERLSKTFPGRRATERVAAVEEVSFEVAPGESVGLVGASGAGKSTIARLVVGLERPDRGTVRLAGREYRLARRGERKRFGRQVHLVLQDPYDALPPSRRVRDIVAEPIRIHGARGCLPVDQALEAVGLPAARFLARFPHELSGGERQRVALARALVLGPRLIVADEPTSLLDLSRRAELLEVMREVTRRFGTAYLYITHDLALARAFCDRLLILDGGRVVEAGSAADVIDRPRHPYTAALVRAAEALAPGELLKGRA